MKITEGKVIPLSKTKNLKLVFISALFVLIGICMFNADDDSIRRNSRYNDPLFVHGVGLALVVFFGVCGAYGVRKLFDPKPGLIFTNAGIYDNSSGIAVGLIPWSEIVGVELYEYKDQKMLVVKLTDPAKYIETGNPFRRFWNRATVAMCGSPVVISPIALTISFEELRGIFDEYLEKYGRKRQEERSAEVI
jgi:hypothetical protein